MNPDRNPAPVPPRGRAARFLSWYSRRIVPESRAARAESCPGITIDAESSIEVCSERDYTDRPADRLLASTDWSRQQSTQCAEGRCDSATVRRRQWQRCTGWRRSSAHRHVPRIHPQRSISPTRRRRRRRRRRSVHLGDAPPRSLSGLDKATRLLVADRRWLLLARRLCARDPEGRWNPDHRCVWIRNALCIDSSPNGRPRRRRRQ